MKKQILNIVLSAVFAMPLTSFAQEQNIRPCDTYGAMEQVFTQDPQTRVNFQKSQIALQEQILNYNQLMSQNKSMAAPEYTIPVVFHILHMGGPENISDAECIAALNQVNSDLAKMGSDAGSVAPPFNNLYIPSDIKLMLAKKDPSGNCTNGIVHRYDTRTNWDRTGNMQALYSGITWNPTKYLNIIVVKQIISQPGQVGIVIGYTFIPGTLPTGDNRDAIVYNHSFLNGLEARSLSHELGHWLGLAHTFGATNNPGITCGDDGITDTPPTKGAFSTCPSSASGNACAVSTTTAYAAGQTNTENIMDYSSCPKNFTTGQTTVMRNVLASPTAGRSNLSSAGNLGSSFTDVNNTNGCAPRADFYPSTMSFTVCKGGSLNMRDFSFNAPVSSYQWAADNSATVASPNASVTLINFPVVGTSNVTLTASNPQGSSSVVKVVTVIDNAPGMVGPIIEGFEASGLPANWAVINPNPSSVTWVQTNSAAYEGINSYYINTFANQSGHEDMLVTPIIDLLNNPGSKFTFRYAYSKYTTNTTDELIIEGSKDCGGSWQNIFTLSANVMANGSGGTSTTPFVPQPDQWKLYDLSAHPNWNQYISSASAMFRFKFKSAGVGNYIYIDAVNLDVSVGINELTRSTRFMLYPNPSQGASEVSFTLNEASDIALNVYDISGRLIETTGKANYASGEHVLSINKNAAYNSGVYFIELSVNGAKMSKKLIID
jgi:hypothetical protein